MQIDQDIIDCGKQVLALEASCLQNAAKIIDQSFAHAVHLIMRAGELGGRVIVTGLGKSGHIGAKIASTFASTGSPAIFLHASEALHGDFGMIQSQDCVLAITYGGQTREVLSVAGFAKSHGIKVIGLTGQKNSPLALLCDVIIDGFVEKEADGLGLAPTSSSTLALALGDALAVSLMQLKNFTKDHFARLHPGGDLGRRLSLVKDHMKQRSLLKVICPLDSFQEVLKGLAASNFGIVAVCTSNLLLGCITDGDIRRNLLVGEAKTFDSRACDMMTKAPRTIFLHERVEAAISKMEVYKTTSLFVLDEKTGSLEGLLRLHDLLAAKVI